MHKLFDEVLAKRDLSKAGELFSLEDADIQEDLSEVLDRICDIAGREEYIISDNDQSVVEICITRVTSAIRETGTIETNCKGLVKLLEVCHKYNLKPLSKDAEPPHAKIASDIMSCLFMAMEDDIEQYCDWNVEAVNRYSCTCPFIITKHYNKMKVMEQAIPVVVKFLSCEHKELSHNVSSYLSLAAIDNADMLAKYMELIVASILKGRYALTRVLPQIFSQNKEPVLRKLSNLVEIMEACGVSERVSLVQVFGMVAKNTPKLQEPFIPTFCELLSVSTLAPLILSMFVDMATANPSAFLSHVITLKHFAEEQPIYMHQVVQVIGATGTLGKDEAKKSMEYMVSQLGMTDHTALVAILQEIKALGIAHPQLLTENMVEISKLVQSGSSAVRILVQQIKEENKKYNGQKETRSVSSQTEGTVTIITVGNPPSSAYPSNVVGVRQGIAGSASSRSSQQSLARSSRASSSNVRLHSERPSSPASLYLSDRASLNSALTLASNHMVPGLPPEPLRDGVQHFCEKHMSSIRTFINNLSARIPLPSKCSIVDGRHKRFVRLNFQCSCRGEQCLYHKDVFTLNTKLPKIWIHLMFLAVQANSTSALSQQDQNVSCLKACWDAYFADRGSNSGFLTLVTSSFPSTKDQDALLQELHNVRYFDVFEFNAAKNCWACFMCNHPEKLNELMPDGSPLIAGQLKEKKGRWKFLKRWKTRYFTLSGSHITCNKSDSRKESLPVSQIQSVKAVRKGIRDIPKAFEIFTADQNYVFKAKGQQNIESWVQCIHLAVAKSQRRQMGEEDPLENIMLERPRLQMKDTKL